MDFMIKNISGIQKELGIDYLAVFSFLLCASFFIFLYKYFSEKLKEKEISKKENEREQLTLLLEIHGLVMNEANDTEIIASCKKTIGVCGSEIEYYSFRLIDKVEEINKEKLLALIRKDLNKIRKLSIEPDHIMREFDYVIRFMGPLIMPILPCIIVFYVTLMTLNIVLFIVEDKGNWLIVIAIVIVLVLLLQCALYIWNKVKVRI